MMNGIEFIEATDGKAFYIEACLKSIIYGYIKLLDSKKSYSRSSIQATIRKITGSNKSLNEIEDYLSDDLINNYVKPCKHIFGLKDFAVNTGIRETKENVKTGILDIKFELPSLLKNHYYIFEAKRIDKYSAKQHYYINHGIARFTNGQYYPESEIVAAGMLGFVETDLTKNPKGKTSINNIQAGLNKKLDSHGTISTSQKLATIILADDTYPEIEKFKFSYLSHHKRQRDNTTLRIYHLLLDYYDILQN
ncbi:MAG TPA: hypothetical protein PKC72_14330 [Chitinophagaceae bacterium]|nr:hypothetical protein [Chitinophagaceae bacterium]